METRKETRAHGETDVLMVCYTPYLDRTAPGTSVSEGAVEAYTNLPCPFLQWEVDAS